MNVQIRHQKRTSLVFRLTADGATVLIPQALAPDSPQVQAFIAEALAKQPAPITLGEPISTDTVRKLVEAWQVRLKVKVTRLQLRAMTHKWGSVSSAGCLTLSLDLLMLPLPLVEYVVVHELVHLKFPNHDKIWKMHMSMYLPNWRDLDRQVQRFAPNGPGKEACS